MSRVELTVTYAILNKSYDAVGKMENFVRVRVLGAAGGTSEYKTKIVEGDKNVKIIWNETISIPVRPSPQVFFEFTVLDEDATTDDVCGVGLLNLNNCGVFSPGANKFNIRLSNGKNYEISGELHVTTKFFWPDLASHPIHYITWPVKLIKRRGMQGGKEREVWRARGLDYVMGLLRKGAVHYERWIIDVE